MTPSSEKPTNAGRFWAWLPALLLGSMLLGLGTLAYIAIDDPHFALEPNYYDKAVHWDEAQSAARDSAALGLKLVMVEPPVVALGGKANVTLRVSAHDGAPLAGAAIELQAFPNAYASRVQHVFLKETAPGVYTAELMNGIAGVWELRFSVTRGSLRYREAQRVQLVKGGAA